MATYDTPSTNYSIPRIDGSSNVSDIDNGLRAAVDAIDAVMVGRASGTLAALTGASPIDGRFYRTTDTGQVFMGTGAAWIEIGVSPWRPGDLKASWLTVAPTGWLVCDGAAVSRTTYAALFAAIGTSAGAGNGSSTFNVPDFRGRVLVMPDGAAGRMASNDARGQSGGEETHTLTTAEVPDLPVVGVNDGGAPPPAIGAGGIRGDQILGGGGSNYSLATTNAGSFSFELKADGGGGAHNSMPPYLVGGVVLVKT